VRSNGEVDQRRLKVVQTIRSHFQRSGICGVGRTRASLVPRFTLRYVSWPRWGGGVDEVGEAMASLRRLRSARRGSNPLFFG
jgi:hypothetical protein